MEEIYNIPVYKPDLSGNEKLYVLDCLDSSWISSKGKYISLFEEKFATYCGVNFAASACNGTASLHLALLALGIGPGDEVIVPTLTYVASVNAISYVGATPVFCDSLYSTWQINPEEVRKKVTVKTKAIMAVHLYGHPCEIDTLRSICQLNNLFLIEDCAEAIGALYKGQRVGTFGDISTFSFFGNKTITCGEGGMVVTNQEYLDQRVRSFKGQGLAQNREYWHDVLGYNYRMTNIEAAIGLAQLEKVDEFLYKKKKIAELYSSIFSASKIHFQKENEDCAHSYWMFSILASNLYERDRLRQYLDKNKIETRPVFYPIHTLPIYNHIKEVHDVAEDLSSRGINLPSYPGLTDEQVIFIAEKVISFHS